MAFASGSAFGSAFGGNKPAGSLFGNSTSQPAQSTGSLFGQTTQQQQPAGGLFGQQQPQQQQPQQQTGGLFGQTNQQTGTGTGLFGQTTTQQPAGGLFGQNTQAQTQPAGGLFGQTTTQPTGGLFGQSTQQNQPAAGGLFGNTQQNQQPAAGGLFGNNQQQQQQTSGGLFGQSTTQPTGGLFGQSTTQNQQPGGLFGSTNQPQQQQGGLFGNTAGQQPAQQQNTGLFGSTTQQPSLFGSSAQPQQSNLGLSSLGQPSPQTLLTKGTKFNDLPDEIKKIFEGIDSQIQGRVQISKELQQRKLGEESIKGQELIRSLHKEYVDASTFTHNDLLFMRDLKAKAEQAVEDTIVATRIVEGFRNPQAGGAGGYLKDHAGFPLEFFTRVTENMKHRLDWYKSTIEQIERKLSSAGHSQTPQGIAATLQAQHATFIALANKTALVDAELQKIKVIYTQLWRQKTGSMRDPFNPLDSADNSDYGMSTLDVK